MNRKQATSRAGFAGRKLGKRKFSECGIGRVTLYTALLSEPDAFVPMAEVVARVMRDHPSATEIANRLATAAPPCFLELAGRDIARRAADQLNELRAEAGELADRLAAFPGAAEATIGTAALWNADVSAGLYEITDPFFGEPTLKHQVEMLWIRLVQLRDAIPPALQAATAAKRGRKTEAQTNRFLDALARIWKELTGLPPNRPVHRRIDEQFVGDFLDFSWAAVKLGRKLPKGNELGLPSNKYALGKRLTGIIKSSQSALGK
jgi:hypothetical protein